MLRCSEVTVDACQPSAGADGSGAAVRCETRVPHGRHLLSVGLYWNETGTSQGYYGLAYSAEAWRNLHVRMRASVRLLSACPPALPLPFRPRPS